MLNKIFGCLYGQALGDAFAMPAQVHPDDTERAFGWLDSWQAALGFWSGSQEARRAQWQGLQREDND